MGVWERDSLGLPIGWEGEGRPSPSKAGITEHLAVRNGVCKVCRGGSKYLSGAAGSSIHAKALCLICFL